MTSRERMLAALERRVPDRLPVTVHQWQEYHLKTSLGGMTALEAFRSLGLDAALAVFDECDVAVPHPEWRETVREVACGGGRVRLHRTVHTPEGVLTEELERDEQTTWTVKPLCKEPRDALLIAKYLPVPALDVEAVAKIREQVGDSGIVRGTVWGPQAGPWQHACCLFGVETMIYATFDDPGWVHRLLESLTEKKLKYVEESLARAPFDLIETGGGAASSTVISPKLFREFCLPYDRLIHRALHRAGHRVVYHTCGGMMPLLDLIVETECDASETLAPPGVGGDAQPRIIKERIGHRVCLIGGMDQQLLAQGPPDRIRQEVLSLFEALGPGGGYIMAPSDHFFDVPVEHLVAYAQAARSCTY